MSATRRVLRATLLLYPRSVRHHHGEELESLVEDLIVRDGRSRPAVMGRLAVDGLSQRLSSTVALWTVLITLVVTSVAGLAVSDFAAASAHAPARAHRAPHRVHARRDRRDRIRSGSVGIMPR